MPKIQVYKSNGSVIPIDEAKKATAFQCPWTNEIFLRKDRYVRHLKNLRRNRIHQQIRAKQRAALIHQLNDLSSFEDIIEWIGLHTDLLYKLTEKEIWPSHFQILKQHRDDWWVKISYLKLSYSKQVSNSHSCPRNGVTNWSGREQFKDGTDKPRSYPGWEGRIEFQVSHDQTFESRAFTALGIHTGTGGGNGKHYGYDVQLFESDWPGLSRARTMALLGGPSIDQFKYGVPDYFKW